jgi:ABC-type antimicrobial peptide transport system permease subunit
MQVIGVVRDFHYSTASSPIKLFAFRYMNDKPRILNIKVASADMISTMEKIGAIWKKIDPVHPIEVAFYKELLEQAYQEISGMVKIIGFLALLAISIASLGLLGMVVFTTETRIREVSIRKVFGASESSLMFMLGRGFIVLLVVAALIAVPVTYHFVYNVMFSSMAYKATITFLDIAWGVLAIFGIALTFIMTMTLGVARTNPTHVLRGE